MNQELLENIYKTLKNAGFEMPSSCPGGKICIIDPTCIWPPLLDFIHTAWILLTIATVALLAGWGATMLRGANHDMVKNLRTLVLIFGVLSATLPILKVIGGENVLINQCNVIELPQQDVAKLLETAQKSLEKANYESFEIIDSQYDNF